MKSHLSFARYCATLTILSGALAIIGCGPKAPVSTPLHDAAMTDDPAKVQAAIAATPGGVDALNADKETALIVASKNGLTNSAKALLDAGANIAGKDAEYGYTALHWAAYKGQLSTVQLLIDRGANVNATDLKLETPIMPASEAYPDVVK